MKKISEYGLCITKTVYYKVSCGVVVGWVLKATVVRGLDPATICWECIIPVALFNWSIITY
jgi:hypothetical protein